VVCGLWLVYVLWSVECDALATGVAFCLNVCTVQHVVSAVGSGVCYVGCGGWCVLCGLRGRCVCIVCAVGGGVLCGLRVVCVVDSSVCCVYLVMLCLPHLPRISKVRNN
jgi:hypothetical protein